MSYGAISRPAVLALSNGARMAGIWMNTGEGALSSFHLKGGGDIVFQIGTAKYGVCDETGNLSDEKLREIAAHEQVRMFEIKLSQGAKPGKGGILPAEKVSAEIAAIRGIPQGQASISPNRHVEIKSESDLLDMIDRVRRVTGKPTGFKTVIGADGWLEKLFLEIHERGLASAPDFITVDGAEGGTGAAPLELSNSVGMPLREGQIMVRNMLVGLALKDKVNALIEQAKQDGSLEAMSQKWFHTALPDDLSN